MNTTRTFFAGLRLSGAAALAVAVVSLGAVTGCGSAVGDPGPAAAKSENNDGGVVKSEKVVKSEAEWREQLTPAQYRVLRQKGTEPAFTGEFWNTKDIGTYHCAACDEALFRSDTKFDSGCGWPSFFEPLPGAKLEEHRDLTHGMVRTEIVCGRCDSHLGHVFEDGPPPTGLRYCINSVSLKFEGDEKRRK